MIRIYAQGLWKALLDNARATQESIYVHNIKKRILKKVLIGGPLLVFDPEGGTFMQIGIVSWSIKPCTAPPYTAGVYTWIERQTGIEF